MIPENRLSTVPVPSSLLVPMQRDDPFIDFERAGAGLQDPSQGLDVQLWTLRYDVVTGDFVLSAPTYPPAVQFNRANVTWISLSFDSNMNPFISFTEAGVSKFWWFDTVLSQQVFNDTIIPTATSHYATLDDRRSSQNSARDILLFYIRAGNLYYRQQRDRYTIERLLRSGVTGDVLIAGMQTNLRVGITVGSF